MSENEKKKLTKEVYECRVSLELASLLMRYGWVTEEFFSLLAKRVQIIGLEQAQSLVFVSMKLADNPAHYFNKMLANSVRSQQSEIKHRSRK